MFKVWFWESLEACYVIYGEQDWMIPGTWKEDCALAPDRAENNEQERQWNRQVD